MYLGVIILKCEGLALMDGDNEMEQRINDLEIHTAHQEQVIADLSDTVSEQWQSITELGRRIDRLQERFSTMEEDVQAVLPADQPPPHY